MSDVAISIRNLSKLYHLGKGVAYHTLRETLMDAATWPVRAGQRLLGRKNSPRNVTAGRNDIWAVRNVSFDVHAGEVVGIIGRNGAGKSTLLKILSRITEPTAGEAHIHGRVGSLLEVGTGFHPELTGRENVYLNGAILGMRRAEIRRKFNDIVEFAELERFIDTPVKRYSSGMYTRLAFAVAAHLEPEILVVDEVLAVGDAAFQKKCLGKMHDVARSGRTVLFVSHQMGAIENLCTRAVLLDQGSLVMQGKSHDVIDHYLRQVLPTVLDGQQLAQRTDRTGNGRVRLTSFRLEDASGQPVTSFRSGMDCVLAMGYECPNGQMVRNVDVGLSVHSSYDQMLFVLYRSYKDPLFDQLPAEGIFRCRIGDLPLPPGRYRVQARVTANGDEADFVEGGVGFMSVEPGDFYGSGSGGFDGPSVMMVDGRWGLSTTGKEATHACA